MTQDKKSQVLIGLSFGTLNSSVAIVDKEGRGETIANEDGDRNIPSYYAFTSHGEELAGSQAKVQAMSNPKGTITQFRNLLGKKFHDEETTHHAQQLFMNIVPSSADASYPTYETESYPEGAEEAVCVQHTPQEVAAKYLRTVKETAENFLGNAVEGCVISTPVHFEEAQREALLAAVKEAGFATAHTIHEPVAAALAFDSAAVTTASKTSGGQQERSLKRDKLVVVLDLGGHQFNVSVLSSNNGLYSVITSVDDERLGGVHFDEVIMDSVAQEFKRKTKMDIGNNRRARSKLHKACEQTKRSLTRQDNAPVSVESLYEGIDYHGTFPRARFEMLAEPLYRRSVQVMQRALDDANVKVEDVDEVLLVGGSSRMPRFLAVTRKQFPDAAVRSDVEPDEAVANGCAVQANIILAHPNVDYPASSRHAEVTQAHTLSKSVGLALPDGSFHVVLPARCPVPVRRTLAFAVPATQKEVYLAVHEGESKVAKENDLILELVLGDLYEGSEAQATTVDVVFTIERDNVLAVSIKEKATGKKVKAKVQKK
ncbi:Hsp70 protein that interacts with Zuo1p [Thoreauomyces humboldtii]|nr:Hsp70 protein that interacts with Zuo1p [Thoreauomyces humboldtii]